MLTGAQQVFLPALVLRGFPQRGGVRLATETFKEAIDDLARYVLGVDDEFEKLIPDA